MVGLRDVDCVWRDQADEYAWQDAQIYQGNILVNHPHIIRYAFDPQQARQALGAKTALRNNQNEIIGVIGSTIDITDHQILQRRDLKPLNKKHGVNDITCRSRSFSKKQITLLQYIIMGYSAADIGCILNRSKRTIEGHIEHLKNKLQCTSKAEIIRWTVTSGLLHGIDWPKSHVKNPV
jgi:DNA-binding CsgD family transcriptional regulator